MSLFIESLYRLYRDNKINKDKLNELLAFKKINQQEYDYIIAAENSNEEVV